MPKKARTTKRKQEAPAQSAPPALPEKVTELMPNHSEEQKVVEPPLADEAEIVYWTTRRLPKFQSELKTLISAEMPKASLPDLPIP